MEGTQHRPCVPGWHPYNTGWWAVEPWNRGIPQTLSCHRTLWELHPAEGQGSRWLHETPAVRTQPTAQRQLIPVAPTEGQLQAGLGCDGVGRAGRHRSHLSGQPVVSPIDSLFRLTPSSLKFIDKLHCETQAI